MAQEITYRVDHDPDHGWPIIVRININGSETSQAANPTGDGPLRPEFDAWNATQVPPLVVAIVPPPPPPTPTFFNYAQPFVNNGALWVKMWKALDDARATFVVSGATAGTILTNLKAQVTAVVAVIATAPQGVQDALTQERVLEGSTTAVLNSAGIAALTAAEARIIIDVCQKAATKGIALAIASLFLSLDS